MSLIYDHCASFWSNNGPKSYLLLSKGGLLCTPGSPSRSATALLTFCYLLHVLLYFLSSICSAIKCPLSIQTAASAHRMNQFTSYHQRWLADCVHEGEEDSCNQWLLQQSPEMTTVREAEEYRPGRVRYRYTTGVGLPAEVQNEGNLFTLMCN